LFEHRNLLPFEPTLGVYISTGPVGLAFHPWKSMCTMSLETHIYAAESSPGGL